MKTFIISVFSAVAAGLIIFFAQSWWADKESGGKQKVRFENVAAADFDKKELTALAAKANEYQKPNITIISAKNVGSEDISDKSFSIASEYIWAFGSIRQPNGNPNNAKITYDGKVLTVKYRLLPKDSEHSFWVAAPGIPPTYDFLPDTSGVKIYTSLERIQDDNPFPWMWFAGGAALLVTFLVGMGAGHATVVQELAKRGHDYTALTTAP